MSEAYRCIVGIDPGVTGGIAFLWPDGQVAVIDIPSVDGEIDVAQFADQIRLMGPRAAIVERASARPGQGVSSTFRFGAAYGALRGTLAALGVPQHIVSPAKWKKHFALTANKEKSRALAIRLWPSCDAFRRKKDHGRAEAALIARYGAETICALRALRAGAA